MRRVFLFPLHIISVELALRLVSAGLSCINSSSNGQEISWFNFLLLCRAEKIIRQSSFVFTDTPSLFKQYGGDNQWRQTLQPG